MVFEPNSVYTLFLERHEMERVWQRLAQDGPFSHFNFDSLLVLTTPHHVCNSTMRQPCTSKVSPSVCKDGQRNSLGSYRLAKTLRQLSRDYYRKRVVLFDTHRLTMNKCKYNLKDDDLHFHKFIFFELYAIWHKVFKKMKKYMQVNFEVQLVDTPN